MYAPGSANPETAKFASRGVGNGCFSEALGEPTDHHPGSEEKLKILEARAALRQPLFHPEDGHGARHREWLSRGTRETLAEVRNRAGKRQGKHHRKRSVHRQISASSDATSRP